MDKRIWLSSPHMGGSEMKYVQDAFESNWIAPLGPNVNFFEKELSEYLQIKDVAVLSSGTAAIHLSLILLGIKQGDEVITSSFTFSATVNPIVYQGATPVLVDSEPETWNMCPELLERAIKDRISLGKKPKAILVVHLYGMPADMDAITSIAEKYNVPLIEDAAEALGSRYNGKYLGTLGIMGILSFNGNKIITTSGGGALISENREFIERARFLSTQARDNAPHYQHSQIGYNYRMSNIIAGIGRGQLEVIESRIEKRRKNFEFYKKSLSAFPGISFLEEKENYFSNRWLTTILIDPNIANFITRETVQEKLSKSNIESRPLWKPMHLQPIFNKCPAYLNGVSENLFSKGLCLPSGSDLEERDLTRVVEIISNTFYHK